MAIDYSVYDFKKSYTVHEAAMAWAETEYEPENAQKAYDAIYRELMRDVRDGVVPARVKRDIRKNWINLESDYSDRTNWSKAEIWAEDLKRWTEERGQKPKFLFPEMREVLAKKDDAVSKKKSSIKPLPPRENIMHAVLERVCLALYAEYKRWPQAKKVLRELEKEENNPDRPNKYDPEGIIQEIVRMTIYWVTDGTDEPKMELKTLRNRIGLIKEKHKIQRGIRKVPA